MATRKTDRFLEPGEIERAEHLALLTRLDFHELCAALKDALDLSDFIFGAENETEFGEAWSDRVAINVSYPYEDGKLREWDDTCPYECNAGITIEVPKSSSVSDNIVDPIARAIARALRTRVFHHRTWHGPGRNTTRATIYEP